MSVTATANGINSKIVTVELLVMNLFNFGLKAFLLSVVCGVCVSGVEIVVVQGLPEIQSDYNNL